MNNPASRKRHPLRWLLTFLGVFLICSGLGYGCFVPRLSVDRFRSQVEADLPVGTPRKEDWLRVRQITYWGIENSDRPRMIWGDLFNTGPLFSSIGQMTFEFYFDGDDKLEKFIVFDATPSL